MNRKFFLLLCAAALGTAVFSGCASMRAHRASHEATTGNPLAQDVHDAQTDSLRKTMDDSRALGTPNGETAKRDDKTKGKVAEKATPRPRGFQYGGLSSEAREIEDHLYAH